MNPEDRLKNVRVYTDKLGQRQYTAASLREKIQDQYRMETAGRTDILSELDTRAKRLAAVREVADYILAQEYVQLPSSDKNALVEQATANLFYFGVLDQYLRDPLVTEMTLEGIHAAYARHGFGELEPVAAPFDDFYDFETHLARLIAPAGAEILPTTPFIEVGMTLHDRPVRVSLIGPPIQPHFSVQVRLHPPHPLTLEQLTPNFIPQSAVDRLLPQLVAGRGLIVTGEAGVGKTTLIAALLKHLPTPAEVVIVERAQEMVLAEGFTRWPALPTNQQTPGLNFITRLQEAVQKMGPRCLVVDEIRGDEGEAFWLALHSPRPTQVILAQRGTSNPARLYSALKIALNKADPTLSAENINAAILARLPYVLSVQRPRRSFPPRLTLLAQWVIEGEGLTLAPLIRWPADQAPQEIDPPHSAQG